MVDTPSSEALRVNVNRVVRAAGWTMPEHKGDAEHSVPPTAFRSLRVLDLSEPHDVYATSRLTDRIVLRIAVSALQRGREGGRGRARACERAADASKHCGVAPWFHSKVVAACGRAGARRLSSWGCLDAAG
jgi:hypothetical protein